MRKVQISIVAIFILLTGTCLYLACKLFDAALLVDGNRVVIQRDKEQSKKYRKMLAMAGRKLTREELLKIVRAAYGESLVQEDGENFSVGSIQFKFEKGRLLDISDTYESSN